MLVQKACLFDCHTTIKMAEKEMNAKSLLGMMSLSLTKGAQVEIITDGSDEENASETLEKCLTTKNRKVG